MLRPVLLAVVFGVGVAGCGVTYLDSYLCANPDGAHLDANGVSDPCHVRDPDAGTGDAGASCMGECLPLGPNDLFENGEKSWSQGPIEDPDCVRLVDEILVLAMVINLSEPPTASPAEPSPPVNAPAPAPSPPPAEKPAPPGEKPAAVGPDPDPDPGPDPEAARVRLALGSGVQLGDGLTPSPMFSLNVGVRWPVVSIALEARSDLPLTGTSTGGVPVQTHVVAGAVVGCLHASSLYLYGCGIFAAGLQRGGDPRSASGLMSTVYAGAGGRGGVEIPLTPRVAVQLTGDLLAAIHPIAIRGQMNADDPLREVWRSTPVAGAIQGGLVAFF